MKATGIVHNVEERGCNRTKADKPNQKRMY